MTVLYKKDLYIQTYSFTLSSCHHFQYGSYGDSLLSIPVETAYADDTGSTKVNACLPV